MYNFSTVKKLVIDPAAITVRVARTAGLEAIVVAKIALSSLCRRQAHESLISKASLLFLEDTPQGACDDDK